MVINVAKVKDTNNKMKNILHMISKAFSYVVIVILISCALFFAYYFFSNAIYNKNPNTKLPKIGLYTIISPSMEPNIRVYDVVVTSTVKPETIKIGDVISFISSSSVSKGLLVTHRVINIATASNGELAFQTKGDNNMVADSAMALASAIVGKVMLKLPQLGRIQFFLSQKAGWLVVVVLPALGVIIYDFIKLFRLLGVNEKMEKLGIITKENKDNLKIEDLEKLNKTYDKIKKQNKSSKSKENTKNTKKKK